MSNSTLFSLLAILHGVFYVLTGVWPLVSIGSFLRVTGPKTDIWLVRTLGILITVVGAAILTAAYRDVLSPELLVVAIGATLALATVDVIYVTARVIPFVYLLDAVVELILAAAWIFLAVEHYT